MATKRLGDAIDAFLEQLRRQKRSPATVANYKTTLGKFQASTKGNPWLTRITPADIHRFFYGSGKNPGQSEVAGSSFNLYRRQVRVFLSWCVAQEWLATDLFGKADIEKRPTEIRDKLWLSPEQSALLLDAASDPEDRVAVAIGLEAAPRESEALRLRIRDVDLDRKILGITITKSRTVQRRKREHTMSPWLEAELLTWLRRYAEYMHLTLAGLLAHGDWFVLPTRTCLPPQHPDDPLRYVYNPRASLSRLNQVMHRAATAAGWDLADLKGQAYHVLRRTSAQEVREATRMGDGPEDLSVVQAHLGHADISTTQVYLDVTRSQQQLTAIMRSGNFRVRARTAGGLATVTPLASRISGVGSG